MPDKRTPMIGCNIRRGQIPGSMTNRILTDLPNAVRCESRHVKAAANAFLEKRGLHREPNTWTDMTRLECAAAKRKVEGGPTP